MGIALLTFVDLFADVLTPLQSFAGRWLALRRVSRRTRDAGLRYVSVQPSCNGRGTTTGSSIHAVGSTRRPLRVIRGVDPQRPGQRTGRVVISGRMEDVCAELDRLAALESLDHAVSTHPIH